MPKVPAKVYVTARIGSDHPMGFLNGYEPGKSAFEKKRVTQDKWAYIDYSNVRNARLEKRCNDIYIVGEIIKWVPTQPYPNNQCKIQVDQLVDWQPQIWDNTPTTGFKIVDTVTRYSTSNKLWVVLDPRGVKFEISTDVFEQLIMDTTIVKGVIQDACVWVGNKHLIAAT
jgi:hypothetical protein